MSRFWVIAAGLLVALAALSLGSYYVFWAREIGQPIRVGLLHSRTGAMAISESSMIDAEVLALEEINAQGGLLGRKVEWEIADGASDWPRFGLEARRLINDGKVSVIFGCWTSASRKNVKPVVEELNHLLIYPMASEGLEESPNIIYTGATANQQIIPSVKWTFDTLKARKYFLVGSDYIWPHCVNAIAKDQLKSLGASVAGEEYVTFGSSDVDHAIESIRASKPDLILSTVVGDSNLAFYQKLHEAGIRSSTTPVVSFSIAEDELRKLPSAQLAGDYSAWSYFQSIARPENEAFVRAFKARFGQQRVTSDVMVAAYDSVRLWAQAVASAGSIDPNVVKKAMEGQSINAPEGVVSIDPETRHTWRPVYIAEVRGDGQFEIVWSSEKPVRPEPYPFSRTPAEWDSFVLDLYQGWGGAWSNPRPAGAKVGPPG